MPATPMTTAPRAAVIGGGPAGLMAAEVLSEAGLRVDLYDAMASTGRKFLLAGKGGLNLTHAEHFEAFVSRYAARAEVLRPLLERFGAEALRGWVGGLGIETFVGTSQRVFPADMKAAPLLRGWHKRLREGGVQFHMRQRWTGWTDDGALRFESPDGAQSIRSDVTVLALGGASWKRLGSDGRWQDLLAARGIDLAPLKPSNCGFETRWSEHLRTRFAGQPLKPVAARLAPAQGGRGDWRQGEFVLTGSGVEGSLIYALSPLLREAIERHGTAQLELDLMPGMTAAKLAERLAKPRGSQSMAKHLHRCGIDGVKAALLHEFATPEAFADPARLAAMIKTLGVPLLATRPIDEAISSAGGVRFETLSPGLMLSALPGVFCAGEMLDWEAPTGGYLLTACFATGRAAADDQA
ncbi:MAG: TIGR03862 family flavoprotein [Nevskia sp.]